VNLSDATVAVTGATGFLGRYIVRSLLEHGAQVVGVVRNPDKVPALRDTPGVELRKADLRDQAALTEGFRGCDAVVNNAALVSIGNQGRQALIDANVEGVRNVLRAMVDAGVGRCVHVSSATVYAPKKGHFYVEGDPLRDASARPSRINDYATSKAIGEREAWRMADSEGLALSTARPHTIYGAHDSTSFTKWFKLLMRPHLASAFPVGTYLPSVYAGDLGDAFCRMLERGDRASGKAYNLSSPPELDRGFFAHVDAYRQAGGHTPRFVLPVPVPIRRSYSMVRAQDDLSFRPRPLVDGYRDMLALERA